VKQTLVLTRLEQLRALSDPLRFKMLEALIGAEHSATSLAAALEVPTTRLYHHLELLLEAGLVEVAREVKRRGGEERVFRAAARQLTLSADLLKLNPDPLQSKESLVALARSVLGAGLDELIAGIEGNRLTPSANGGNLVLEKRCVGLSAEAMKALATELPAWLDDLGKRFPGSPADHRIVFAAFPIGKAKRGRSRKES
jgi:DNA-binding transcriptional ArsR family regulator